MDPINYSGMLTQIDLSPLQRGLAQRREGQAMAAAAEQRTVAAQLAKEKFEYDQQRDAEYLAAVQAYQTDPTPQALRDLSLRFPEQAEKLQKAGDSYTASQKRDMVEAGFASLGALSAGNTQLAIDTLEKRAGALKNSGIDASHTQAAIDMIKAGKTKEATAYLSYAMGGLVGADHAAGVLETLGVGGKAEDRRADNARQDRSLDLRERELGSREADRAADNARADRKAAGGGSGGSNSGGSYEYRIGPDGKLQRRKR